VKGRLFLDLCGELHRQVSRDRVLPEMLQILRLLDMRYAPSAVATSSTSLHLAGPALTEVPEMVTGRLLATIAAAVDRWGFDFDHIDHVRWPNETPSAWPAMQAISDRLREESSRYSG
jgi:hypothetical protein